MIQINETPNLLQIVRTSRSGLFLVLTDRKLSVHAHFVSLRDTVLVSLLTIAATAYVSLGFPAGTAAVQHCHEVDERVEQ